MDLSIIGIGIAVTFAIIVLSAITLYLAFRIREIFKEGMSPKAQIVKAAFLIGLLFLAGGLFYFFAQGMPQTVKTQSIANDSGTVKFEPPANTQSIANDSGTVKFEPPAKKAMSYDQKNGKKKNPNARKGKKSNEDEND